MPRRISQRESGSAISIFCFTRDSFASPLGRKLFERSRIIPVPNPLERGTCSLAALPSPPLCLPSPPDQLRVINFRTRHAPGNDFSMHHSCFPSPLGRKRRCIIYKPVNNYTRESNGYVSSNRYVQVRARHDGRPVSRPGTGKRHEQRESRRVVS